MRAITPAPAQRHITVSDQDRADARATLREQSTPIVRSAIAAGILLVLLAALVATFIVDATASSLEGAQRAFALAWLAALLALPFMVVGGLVANSRGIAGNVEQLARDRLVSAAAERREFESRIANAFEMADSEEDALESTERAFAQLVPGAPAELLLADNSHAHLERMAVSRGNEPPGCQVDSPHGCVAARRGQTMVFPDSDQIDACPKLRDRPSGASAAVCVPVSIMGRSVGVLHVTSTDENTTVPDRAVESLQVLANQVGNRVGMLRVMAETQLQASTDSLTGLLNRRSFENSVRTLRRQGTRFALVMADLDHFKRLNDTHGHDAGDRALRVFAETMRAVVRPDDLVCRYGGEEFAVVLSDCTTTKAVAVMERAQAQLLDTAQRGETPPFTASFGVVGGEPDEELEDLVARVDASLYRAKSQGRNRIVVDGQHSGNLGPLFAINGRAAAAPEGDGTTS